MLTVVDLLNLSLLAPLDGDEPKSRPGKMFFFSFYKCLVVKHMFTSLKMRDRRLMIKVRDVLMLV